MEPVVVDVDAVVDVVAMSPSPLRVNFTTGVPPASLLPGGEGDIDVLMRWRERERVKSVWVKQKEEERRVERH
jgi:hypothetical protein